MADLACVYSLTTGGGTLLLNDGVLGNGSADDLFWIAIIRGLDGPIGRVPVDDVPFGDGGLVHASWKGPRRPRFEGSLIAQSTFRTSACQEILNDMEAAFNAVLDAAFAPNSGTLSWTPTGQGALSLTVYYDAEQASLDIQPTDNYRLRSFSFGLVSPAADPS